MPNDSNGVDVLRDVRPAWNRLHRILLLAKLAVFEFIGEQFRVILWLAAQIASNSSSYMRPAQVSLVANGRLPSDSYGRGFCIVGYANGAALVRLPSPPQVSLISANMP